MEAHLSIGQALFRGQQFQEGVSAFVEMLEKESDWLCPRGLGSKSAPPTWPRDRARAALQILADLLTATEDADLKDHAWLRFG